MFHYGYVIIILFRNIISTNSNSFEYNKIILLIDSDEMNDNDQVCNINHSDTGNDNIDSNME